MSTVIQTDMPYKWNLKPIKVGADKSFSMTMKNTNGTAKDITTWSAQMKGRTPQGDEVFDLTVGSGITNGGVNGKFTFTITDTISASFDTHVIMYDILITDGNGDKTYPVEGELPVKESVTL